MGPTIHSPPYKVHAIPTQDLARQAPTIEGGRHVLHFFWKRQNNIFFYR